MLRSSCFAVRDAYTHHTSTLRVLALSLSDGEPVADLTRGGPVLEYPGLLTHASRAWQTDNCAVNARYFAVNVFVGDPGSQYLLVVDFEDANRRMLLLVSQTSTVPSRLEHWLTLAS